MRRPRPSRARSIRRSKTWISACGTIPCESICAARCCAPSTQSRSCARGGGSIINTSSGAVQAGALSYSAYACCKAGIDGLTRYIAAQHGKESIRCNAIARGLVVTPATTAYFSGPAGQMMLSHHLSPRLGQPDDIANAVLFLAGDESAFITGQIINLDGGALSHQPYYADEWRQREAAHG